MPRPRQDQPSFGSDSFLDVVCNVVGILIILMVVVGVRASKSPPRQTAQIAAAPAPIPSLAVLPYPPVARTPEEAPLPVVSLPVLQPPPELVQKAAEAERDAQRTQQDLLTARQRLAELQAAAADQQARAEEARSLLAKMETETARGQETVTRSSLELEERRRRVAEFQAGVEKLRKIEPNVKTLEHQLAPISKAVAGNEIHFRLNGGRVSLLPVDELSREVQQEMQRRKDILITRHFFRGSTRFIQGYSMDYILQREALSVTDEMRAGPGMMRIAVSAWIISPSAELQTESLEQARREDSAFRAALRKHGADSTVTFWVYPDSFDLHRELSTLVREQGYWVASRPLPEGVPIAGSPQGSKSLAQ